MVEQKKTLSAKEVVEDLRAGATDEFLMKKYSISENGLQSLFQKLITAKILTQGDLDRRTKIATDARLPVFKFLCPACKTPHQEEYPVCPQCGIIVEKYREKQAREQAEKDRKLQASLARQQQSRQIQETSAPEQAKISTDPGQVPAGFPDLETADKLAKLQAAFVAGLLSQNEFEQKRDQLLIQTLSSDARTKLEQLRELGLISPEEFEAKQAAIEGRAAKAGQLREALELGILNKEEFDSKMREIIPERPPSDIQGDNAQLKIPAGSPVQDVLTQMSRHKGNGTLHPPPLDRLTDTLPAGTVVLTALGAAGLGIVLALAHFIFYVLGAYNTAAGYALGGLIANRLKRQTYPYSGKPLLLLAAASILIYIISYYSVYVVSSGDEGFWEHLDNAYTIFTWRGGVIINVIVWAGEIFITFITGATIVDKAAAESLFKLVPREIANLVFALGQQKFTPDQIRNELSKRGWTKQEEQDLAFTAASQIKSAIPEKVSSASTGVATASPQWSEPGK